MAEIKAALKAKHANTGGSSGGGSKRGGGGATAGAADAPSRAEAEEEGMLMRNPGLVAIYSEFERVALAFRAHCGRMAGMLGMPVPYGYFHLLKLMMALSLLLTGYALVGLQPAGFEHDEGALGGGGDADMDVDDDFRRLQQHGEATELAQSTQGAYIMDLVTYTVICFIMMGVEQIAIEMSNPFGDDALDFDIDGMIRSAYKNAAALLSDERSPIQSRFPPSLTNPLLERRQQQTKPAAAAAAASQRTRPPMKSVLPPASPPSSDVRGASNSERLVGNGSCSVTITKSMGSARPKLLATSTSAGYQQLTNGDEPPDDTGRRSPNSHANDSCQASASMPLPARIPRPRSRRGAAAAASCSISHASDGPQHAVPNDNPMAC